MEFIGSLHNHSDYSNQRLRDAIARPNELIDYAIELGHSVIAFTEHDTVSNAVKIEKYYNKIKEKHPDFKVILGNEIYLCRDGLNAENFERGVDDYYHFILLAKDAIGHQQIRELSTRAAMRSYMTGKMRRLPTYYSDLLEIIKPNPGHVIGSTACLGGFLGQKIIHWVQNGRSAQYHTQIVNWLYKIEDIFGKGNFYLEIQPSDSDEQECVNREIIHLSKITDIPYIITTDTHYLKKEDAPIHKAFLNAQEGEREVDAFYATTYLMDTQELESYLKHLTTEELQIAYHNIEGIKNACQDYSLLKPLKIPNLKWRQATITQIPQKYYDAIPYLIKFSNSTYESDKQLALQIIQKVESNVLLQNKETYDEINSNLEITWISSEVNKARWSAYFLNLQHNLDICWEAGTLVGPGRGSGVGFLLLYLLDITQINPMWENTKTFAWRFLNPERVSVLDIDTDIEGGKRAVVLQALRDYYGADRVANVITFGTEGSKQAVQTAARGLGIDNDIGLYISSLIPADRGQARTLSQCYYGDEENGFEPVPLFVQQMKEYPELWNVARRIEGLICRIGEHAGGVIFVDEPFTNSTALAKVPNGDVVTQFDLHDCEDCSLIKIDLLSVEALDKIHTCIDLLVEAGYMEPEATLKETYYKYLDIYTLERDDPKMWEMVWNHEIQSLFQMEKQSGIQGIALTKPKSIDDLAVLNSVIRLMAQEKGAEQPLNKFARFKNDIGLWYKEMEQYGLTKEEQTILEPVVKLSYGICESQEKFMQLVQMPECGGFSLTWADKLRKAIAKKNPKGFIELEQEYYQNIKDKGLSKNLCNYVWQVLVSTSKGYGFNASHTMAYSLVALQEMNLAYRFPVIFWNCACLITDSGGADEDDPEEIVEETVDIYEPEDFTEYEYIDAPDRKSKVKKKRNKSTKYDKIASAIGKMRSEGIEITPPNINSSMYTFVPDVANNRIVYGLRGILNVGEDVISDTIANRPYTSPKDYYQRVKPKRSAMVSLIKGGAFDELMDRKMCMAWFIWETCDKKSKLNLQNMATLLKYNLLPDEKEAKRVYEFNRYLKAMCKGSADKYKLDERAINFIIELGREDLIDNNQMSTKAWDKVYQKYMDIFRDYISKNQTNLLQQINDIVFKEDWDKYAHGNYSAWEMEVLCFYYHEHELAHVNADKYGYVDFFSLPEEPVVEKTWYKNGKAINRFKLSMICGTCIAKNKAKGIVTLLTSSGVVNVKLHKEFFALYDKQISERQPDGTKKIIEKSWFNRGSMIAVQGMRSGNSFISKKYANSLNEHRLYKILSIDRNGNIALQQERYTGGIAEDEN